MPFQSYLQEAFLKHRHPEIYKRWKDEAGTKPVNPGRRKPISKSKKKKK